MGSSCECQCTPQQPQTIVKLKFKNGPQRKRKQVSLIMFKPQDRCFVQTWKQRYLPQQYTKLNQSISTKASVPHLSQNPNIHQPTNKINFRQVRQESQPNYSKQQLLDKIQEYESKQKKQPTMENQNQLAFYCNEMINKIIMDDEDKLIKGSESFRILKECGKKAATIYQQVQYLYFQELITLYNNLAMGYHRAGREQSTESINYMKKVIIMQDRYYSKYDERKLLSLNNIACSYYELNLPKQGEHYFNLCLIQQYKSSQIYKQVEANYTFYKNKIA